jgi:hypothetical protein
MGEETCLCCIYFLELKTGNVCNFKKEEIDPLDWCNHFESLAEVMNEEEA